MFTGPVDMSHFWKQSLRCVKLYEATRIVGQLYGVPHGIKESLPLFYTKMSFKILKFSNRPLVFFPSIQLSILQVPEFAAKIQKSVTVNIQGRKVGIIGYITPATIEISR
jgi:maltose-binding protein MalE